MLELIVNPFKMVKDIPQQLIPIYNAAMNDIYSMTTGPHGRDGGRIALPSESWAP